MALSNYALINVGTSPNSKDGDTLRSAFQKINGNFREVILSVEFKVNFDSSGKVTTLENLPEGWSWTKNLNQITITHNKDRSPKNIVYWGLTDVGEYRMRTPTAGYPASRPADGSPSFTLTLLATITGAVNGTHALISVVF